MSETTNKDDAVSVELVPALLLEPEFPPEAPDGTDELVGAEEVPVAESRSPKKRTREQREADLIIVSDMTRKRYTQQQIADHLNSIRPYKITREQVRYDQHRIDYWYRVRNAATRAVRVYRELEDIKTQERELWRAWEDSKKEKKKASIVILKEVDKEGRRTVVGEREIHEKEQQVGDPAIMEKLIKLREQRLRILGLNSPTQLDISSKVEHTVDMDAIIESYKKQVRAEVVYEDANIPALANG